MRDQKRKEDTPRRSGHIHSFWGPAPGTRSAADPWTPARAAGGEAADTDIVLALRPPNAIKWEEARPRKRLRGKVSLAAVALNQAQIS